MTRIDTLGDKNMRTIKRVLIAAAVLGAFSASAREARAAWPVVTTGHQFGGFGFFNAFGVPAFRQFNNSSGFGRMVYSPGAYRTVFTPNSVMQIWASQGMSAFSVSNQFGFSERITSPTFVGFRFNSMTGMQPFVVPSQTVSVGVDPRVIGNSGGLMSNSFFNAGLSGNPIFNNTTVAGLVAAGMTGMPLFPNATTGSVGATGTLAGTGTVGTTLMVNRTTPPINNNVPFGQPVTFGSVTGISAGPGLWFFSGLNVPRPIGGKTAVAPAGYVLP